jgi:ribosomal protein L15E
MTEAEALAGVRGLASANRYLISPHAYERMRLRKVLPADLHHALCQAQACSWQADTKRWRVTGPDRDGDAVDVVVVLEDGLVVVTVY